LQFYEIYKETNLKFHLTSHLKESVRKWTSVDKETGKQAGEEGKRDGEKNLVNWLKPTKLSSCVTHWDHNVFWILEWKC